MATINTALERFDPNDILELSDSFTHRNWALKSLGALLESADFEKYFCRHEKNGDYKGGLNRIVELYVDRQEKDLKDIREKSVNSPERIIMHAWKIRQAVVRGEYANQIDILDSVQGAIKELNQVILRFGDEYESWAKGVRDKLIPFQDTALKKMFEEAEDLYESGRNLSFDDESLCLVG